MRFNGGNNGFGAPSLLTLGGGGTGDGTVGGAAAAAGEDATPIPLVRVKFGVVGDSAGGGETALDLFGLLQSNTFTTLSDNSPLAPPIQTGEFISPL